MPAALASQFKFPGKFRVENDTCLDADGAIRLVGVEPGFFADGLVEITGNVAEGDTVVVP